MKKLLTLALAFVALAVFARVSVGQDKQQVLTGKVTQLNKEHKTFASEVTFSAKAIPLPKKDERVDVIYTANPTGGGPAWATSVKGSKSNTSEIARLVSGSYGVTGKVLAVNARNRTFTVEVIFDGKELKAFPEVGTIYKITFTQPNPGEPPQASNLNSSRSNVN